MQNDLAAEPWVGGSSAVLPGLVTIFFIAEVVKWKLRYRVGFRLSLFVPCWSWRDAGSDTGVGFSECRAVHGLMFYWPSWTARNWPISASGRLLVVNIQAGYGINLIGSIGQRQWLFETTRTHKHHYHLKYQSTFKDSHWHQYKKYCLFCCCVLVCFFSKIPMSIAFYLTAA